jgi:hypothetical protein
MQIISAMELSPIETAALRLSIAKDDELIKVALEAVRLNSDEAKLTRSLRLVCQHTIEATVQEGKSGSLTKNAAATEVGAEAGAGAGAGADSSGEPELTSQIARSQLFPLLLLELFRAEIISAESQATLLRLFQTHNPVIHAALDVYDLDQDMADLVDTLHRLALLS